MNYLMYCCITVVTNQNIAIKMNYGGGGCNPKKPYPSLTFYRVGVGFYWVFSGFLGFINFPRILHIRICTCYNKKCKNDEVKTTFINIENKLPGGPENI